MNSICISSNFCLGFNPLMSAEEVIVDYSYNGNHNMILVVSVFL